MSESDRLRRGEVESKYNASLDILRRINILLEKAGEAAASGDNDGWLNILRVLDREAGSYLGAEEMKELSAARPSGGRPSKGGMLGRASPGSFDFKALDAYERVIRNLLVKKGMGMATGTDKSNIILGGGG